MLENINVNLGFVTGRSKVLQRSMSVLVLTSLSLFSAAFAQDFARVVSRTANLQQILVPSAYCAQRLAPLPAPAVAAERSNAGAVVGAIAGGLLGSTIGRGDGRVAAAAIGAATGALIGDRIDNDPATAAVPPGLPAPISQAGGISGTVLAGTVAPTDAPSAPAVLCQGSQALETRVSGYTVVYEYAGKQYSAQLNRDPGDRLPLVITPDPTFLSPAPITTYAPIDQRRRRY